METCLRMGIIGCGQIAQIMHLPYLQELPGFQIAALAEVSEAQRNAVGDTYGVPAEQRYADYEEMLEKAPIDAVLICNKEHCAAAISAARHKKHILVEKPLAFSVHQGEQMVQAAEENGVVLLVGYMKRYDPAFQYMAKQMQGLDPIYLARFHNFSGSFDYVSEIFTLQGRGDVPKEYFRQGKLEERAGMMEELGEGREELLPAYFNFLYGIVHDTVLLRHLFGERGKVLYADVFLEDNMSVLLQYGTARVSLEIGFSGSMPIWDETLQVYSPHRNLSLEFPFPYLKNAPTIVRVTECDEAGAVQEKQTAVGFEEAYRAQWKHFYDCVVSGAQPITSGKDALEDLRLAGEIMRAVKL